MKKKSLNQRLAIKTLQLFGFVLLAWMFSISLSIFSSLKLLTYIMGG